jgi:hypothetical protein
MPPQPLTTRLTHARLGAPLCHAALDASNNPLGSLSTLSRLTALVELDVGACELTALAGLRGFTGLRALVASFNIHLSLEGLTTGGALTSLEVKCCGLIDLAGPLADCGSLSRLDVSGNRGLTSLGGLRGCSGLTVGVGRGQQCGGALPCNPASRQAWGTRRLQQPQQGQCPPAMHMTVDGIAKWVVRHSGSSGTVPRPARLPTLPPRSTLRISLLAGATSSGSLGTSTPSR